MRHDLKKKTEVYSEQLSLLLRVYIGEDEYLECASMGIGFIQWMMITWSVSQGG